MKNGVEFNGVLDGISTRQDKSLGVRLSTPELTSEEKLLIMELQGIPCCIQFKPLEGFQVMREIKTELSRKTQSERLRAVLYCWHHSLGSPGEFENFYVHETNKFIDAIKAKLPPM